MVVTLVSEFTVCRTADTYQALRYCLLLDGDRIAGGKPDYRWDNILISWNTKETYGVVDELIKENAKLRELVRGLQYCAHEAHGMCARVPVGGERPFTCCPLYDFDAKEYQCEKLMHELGMEVE